MSMQTWLDEFYPVDAKAATPADAIDHSILKWRGALPANCEKHQVVFFDHEIFCQAEFEAARADMAELAKNSGSTPERFAAFTCKSGIIFGAATCALCAHYECAGNVNNDAIGLCPLLEVHDNGCHDAYDAEDPAKMVMLLQEAKDLLSEGGQK